MLLKTHIRQNWQHFIADALTDHDALHTKRIIYGVILSQLINNIFQNHFIDIIAPILQIVFYNATYHIQTALYDLIWKAHCKQTTALELEPMNITLAPRS